MKQFIITLFNGNTIVMAADCNDIQAVDIAVQADFINYLILEPLGITPKVPEIKFEKYEMN